MAKKRMNAQRESISAEVWKEGPTYVAYAPELDVSSCGRTAKKAKSCLKEAVSLYLEELKVIESRPQSRV